MMFGKSLFQNLMTPRRRDFRLASSSDDEQYLIGRYGEEERRRGEAKSTSPRRGGPEKARLLRCRASTYH